MDFFGVARSRIVILNENGYYIYFKTDLDGYQFSWYGLDSDFSHEHIK